MIASTSSITVQCKFCPSKLTYGLLQPGEVKEAYNMICSLYRGHINQCHPDKHGHVIGIDEVKIL